MGNFLRKSSLAMFKLAADEEQDEKKEESKSSADSLNEDDDDLPTAMQGEKFVLARKSHSSAPA